MNNITKSCIFAIFISILNIISVSALSNTKFYQYNGESITGKELKKSLCNSDVGEVIFPTSLKAGNKDIELYCHFSDKESVLKEINEKYSDTINFVKEHYSLSDELNSSNWKEYNDYLWGLSNDYPDIDKQMIYDASSIVASFDIYENDEINEQITDLVELYNNAPAFISSPNDSRDLYASELDLLIPNYSDNFGTIKSDIVSPMVNKSLNVDAAVDYAVTYAKKANSYYHYFLNGDCTNFISQILEASGVKQEVYDSEYSGWWHKRTKQLIGYKHTHSRSWTMADTFSRYMGITVKTTDILKWASGLRRGDIIALDKTNDGSFDHLGFVVAVSSDTTIADDPELKMCVNIPNVTVAQHTTNYLAPFSSSENGWETYYRKAAFGRIRG